MQEKLHAFLEQLAEQMSDCTTCIAENDRFNIFTALDVADKEVILCRFLGALLDPNGSHGMGAYPLSTFVRHVLNDNTLTEEEAQHAYVVLEDRIDNDRRVDIAIYLKDTVWPIEVKVWADDQEAQLIDYYQYYKKRYRLNAIYYLTPTGWMPSPKSQGTLSADQIVCLSFTQTIRQWMEEYLLPACQNKEVYFCTKQFIEVIKNMASNDNELRALISTLNLAANGEMNNLDEINAALTLLAHKDDLQKAIWKRFLRANLKCGVGFELADCEAGDLEIDKHALLRVNYEGTAVAWICVETNLYLCCKKVKDKAHLNWHLAADSEYQWIYLSPSANKKYPMRDRCLKNEEINIVHILQDIETDGIDKC